MHVVVCIHPQVPAAPPKAPAPSPSRTEAAADENIAALKNHLKQLQDKSSAQKADAKFAEIKRKLNGGGDGGSSSSSNSAVAAAPGLDEIFKHGYDGRVVGTGGFVGQAAINAAPFVDVPERPNTKGR